MNPFHLLVKQVLFARAETLHASAGPSHPKPRQRRCAAPTRPQQRTQRSPKRRAHVPLPCACATQLLRVPA